MGVYKTMPITNTTIADLVLSEKILGATVNALIAEQNPLITSGLAISAPEFTALANGGSRKATIAFLNPLDSSAYNLASDDINQMGDVGKMTAGEFTALRHDLNYGFGTADLARMVTLYNAENGIAEGIAQYWNGVLQRRAAATLKGIKASTSALTIGVAGASAVDFSLDLVIDAATDAGMYANQFNVLIVSPVTQAKLKKMEKNSYIPASQTNIDFDTWAGYRIIVDQTFGNEVSVIARAGALAFGLGNPAGMIPFEVERLANAGNGQGADILHTRRSAVLHPQGFNYKGASSPTEATTSTNLAHAGSWELAVPREMVGFRFINHS
jgi:hypothetical protein